MKNLNISRFFIKIVFAAGLLSAAVVASCTNADGTIPPTDAELGITTLPVGDITVTSAFLNGCYRSDYSDYIADTGFDYRKSGETSWTRVWLGTAPVLFRYQLEDLEGNTAYEFMALAKRSDGGVVEGNSIGTFTTDPVLYDSPFIINGIAAGTKAVVTFVDGTTQDITVDRQITSALPVKMIYSISSTAFLAHDILIGRMSDETIQLSFGTEGAMQLRESGGRILINTYAELALINASETLLASNYLQDSDIDLLGSENITAAGLERRNWVPVGVDYMNCFAGNYDGGEKEISNIYIAAGSDYTGFFGSNSGTLSNIRIASGSVSGAGDYTGGICGLNFRGTIKDCHNAAQVSGTINVGGVCGLNNSYSMLADCHNTGQVSATGNGVGGVCGSSSASDIRSCYNAGQVSATGSNNVGGICGENRNGSILTSSYNIGSVKGKECVGGVCGFNNNTGKVTACRNDGDVSGDLYVSGVCGFNIASMTIACCNTGEVIGGVLVGGVCGFNNAGSTINSSYNVGQVSGTTNVGGVSGLNTNSTITTSYWLKYAAGPSNGIGAPPSDNGAALFDASSWPTWTLWTSGTPDPVTGPFWKSIGEWTGGGTPDGVNSTFPKLYWEK